MAKTEQTYIKVTMIKSAIGRIEPQKRTAKALGLRRISDTAVVPENPAVMGMVNSIAHLVKVEPAEAPAPKTTKREVASSPAKATAPHNDGTSRPRAEEKVETKTEEKPKPTVKAAAKKPAAKVAAAKPAAKPAAAKKTTAKATPSKKTAGAGENK